MNRIISTGRIWRLLTILFCVPLLPCAAFAADWLQTHWQSEQGLPSNTVHAIVQTRDGYIWIGTKRGLVRFDGVRFTVFNRAQLEGLADSSVYALCETADGTLWIGGERGGVTRYREGRFSALPVAAGLQNQWISSIQRSRHGDVLIRTANQLVALRGANATVLLPDQRVLDELVSAFQEDRNGGLWIGTTKSRLLRFDHRLAASKAFTPVEDAGHFRFNQIYEDRTGAIWLGTAGALLRYDGSHFDKYRFARESLFTEVNAIQQDMEGGIWAGMWGQLVRWKDGRFTTFPLEDGGTDNEVIALAADRENNIWVGTRNYGLYRFNQAKFLSFTRRHGLSNNSVKSILADSKGRVWVGADVGLNLLDGGRFRSVAGTMSRVNVRSLAEDRDGSIWAGSWNQVYRLRDGEIRVISINHPGLPRQVTTSLLPASDGTLYIGTRMGLLRLKGGVLSRITSKDGLASDFIRAMIESRDGSVWLATSQGGVNRLKDGGITSLTTADGLASKDIYSLYEDREGNIWIGTMEDGFCRWKNGTIRCFGFSDGLFDDGAYQIQEDAYNNLWIGGGGGIYRVSKKDLDERSEGRIRKVNYVAYGEADGMPSLECRGGHQPTSGRTHDGRLWFTTIRGLVVIDPAKLRRNEIPPLVAIEGVKVNDDFHASSAIPELPLGEGKAEFQYTALSFVDASRIQFKYRLIGFDRDWVEAGSRRIASYTNLPPGRFVFQVMASNNDGVWNHNAASLQIGLKPPFHRTPWFLVLCAALVAALGFGAHWYKLSLMESRFAAVLAERTRIAREMHDTVMQGMTGISAQLEAASSVLAESPSAARGQLDRLRNQAQGIVEETRRSVWNLRPKSLDDGNLVTAIRSAARELTQGLPVQVLVELRGLHRPLPEFVEKNLLRIAQEAVANAVQHGKPSCIRIGLRFDADQVSLIVEDDGKGFDPSVWAQSRSGHYGLLGVRERAEQLSAEYVLQSAPGGGTKVEVAIPHRVLTTCQQRW